MYGFPVDTWVLAVVSVVPGMALAVWNARRVSRALRRAGTARESSPAGGPPPGR